MITYVQVSIFISSIIVCILSIFKRKFSYWKNKNVPYIVPSFPYGTFESHYNKKYHNAILLHQQYNHLKAEGHEYGGLYLFITPILMPVGIEMVRNVMIKDFQYFTDHGFYHNEKDDPLSANLFNLEGTKWRTLRSKLTPTFTTGKIKGMFPIVVACAEPLCASLFESNIKNVPVNVKDLLARYTIDVIGSCAFGIECNSFTEPESKFRQCGLKAFSPLGKLTALKFAIASASHSLGRRLRIVKIDRESLAFFLNAVRKTVNHRKENNVKRNDFLQLLMDLGDEPDSALTIEQIAAQAFIFFLAGFETSSTTMTFCLYELAVNPDIQEKVRREIKTTLEKYDGNITYEAIMEMKYIHNVIEEALRKYPPIALIHRVCVQNYKIPNTEIIIEKGTRVMVPVYSLHHDPEHFSNPDKFDPDRFSEDNRANIKPFTYLPFGEGPRICIAQRFGLIQTKIGLIAILRNFKLRLNPKTTFPAKFARSGFVLTIKGGVWLDTERIY